ncbi:DNA topoisomerase VI subunit B [Candidatus Woesearchaeota archaeon]|nr:DNA topoisomerase VI subunit B [Candidatus Woesearchaeota archaeon]
MSELTAVKLAQQQREVSVAEFFERNRHLLGFDNKRKALLTVVKEACDNSLDATEEARVLPEINVEIIDLGNDKFRIIVEDNGPGIVKKQIPNVFGKLLYGSKFHSMKMSRGQQGIGISASCLYAQLTTGRPLRVISKISPKHPAVYMEIGIDTKNNRAQVFKEEEKEWKKEHGTRIELDIEGSYQKGEQSVDVYLKETAIVNPHATILYTNPKAEQLIFPRATDLLPVQPKEIKPHPYGVEHGILMKMLQTTESRTLQSFLTNDFSRVGPGTAKEICQNARLLPNSKPSELTHPQIEQLMEGIKNTKIIAPPADCISPIGAELLEKGLKKEVNSEFYATSTRSPEVYRGIPFIIEAGIAYGGEQAGDQSIRLLRFANRVPLLYQQSSCATFKAITGMNWRQYGLSQSQGALPIGPVTVVVHLASVWPPFTSEAKEAIAHYPEIIKEMRLALQDCGRKLSSYINKKKRVGEAQQRISIFENYIPEVAGFLEALTGEKKEKTIEKMRQMLSKNKELIQQYKEAHEVTKREAEEKEDQIELKGAIEYDE